MMARAGLTVLRRDGFAFGCQFYVMKVFLIDEMRSALLRRLCSGFLSILLRTKLYHFEHARLNSLLGFQVVAVAQKIKRNQ